MVLGAQIAEKQKKREEEIKENERLLEKKRERRNRLGASLFRDFPLLSPLPLCSFDSTQLT